MKNYTITVNGIAYEVSVEENTGMGVQQAAPVAPVAAPKAPAPAVAPKAEPAKPAPAASGSEGSIKVESPMPGKILSIKANAGQQVKKGDVILVLEAMKMENEIVSSEDGTIASINVSVGEMVESGSLLATID